MVPNGLDFVLGGILLFSVLSAVRNGITKEAIRITALIVGSVTAMWGYGLLGLELRPWIQNGKAAAAVGFALIFLGCLIAGALLARALASVWTFTGLRWIDRLMGGVFGLARGLLITGMALLALLAFEPLGGSSQLVADSRLAPWILNVARTAASFAPQGFREAVLNGFTGVEREQADNSA